MGNIHLYDEKAGYDPMEVFANTFTDRVAFDIGGMLLKVNYRTVGPRWMEVAKKELGVTEITGTEDNPRIIEYHDTTTAHWKEDETAWCSSFVNWVMKQSGYEGTNSSWAKDWKKWKNGKIISKPVYGAIFVIDYNYKPIPPDKTDNGGHVGFVVGQEGRSIWVLGGNQGGSKKQGHHRGRVQVSKYNLSDGIEGWYWFVVPEDYEDNSGQLGPYKEEADIATRESTL